MGVDAKALLTECDGPIAVAQFLNRQDFVRGVSLRMTDEPKFVWVDFEWRGEKRLMACFFDGNCISDYESVWPHSATLVSIGCWGFSDAIIMKMVRAFCGFYILNDGKDDWMPINAQAATPATVPTANGEDG